MKAQIILCDSAQVQNGKLYILGGGWSINGPVPTPHAVAIQVSVPWNDANRKHDWQLSLVDDDGTPFMLPASDGTSKPFVLAGQFETGRPAGVSPGSSLESNLAINFGPIPWQPGKGYEWRFSINGECKDNWKAAFTVRA